MESHAKHGDSIFWEGPDALYVNLYIPAVLDWRSRGMRVALETGYPFEERVILRFDAPGDGAAFDLALRLPAWCDAPAAQVNDQAVEAVRGPDGYLHIRRTWRGGDSVRLALPMRPRFEAMPDDPSTVALLHGPVVLAADLGAAGAPYDGPAPALVGDDLLSALVATRPGEARFRTRGIGQPGDLELAPFYGLHDRRTAVYFKRYSPSGWREALAARAVERERAAALDARSIDIVRLGVEADEQRHRLASEISYAVSYRFRPGRDARTGGFLEFDAAVRDEPLVLRAIYWGGERDRLFHVEVEGRRIATQRLHGEHPGEFIERDYALPAELLRGKERVRIRFQPESGHTAGPVFGCRILPAQAAS
jgi:hypothetical protein